MNKIIAGTGLFIAAAFASVLVHAQDAIVPAVAETTAAQAPVADTDAAAVAVEVGNKICPVSGEKIDGSMGEIVKMEHNGKMYSLCCGMCTKDFNKDPDKFAAIADKEVSAQ